jgi:hypothetical protein
VEGSGCDVIWRRLLFRHVPLGTDRGWRISWPRYEPRPTGMRDRTATHSISNFICVEIQIVSICCMWNNLADTWEHSFSFPQDLQGFLYSIIILLEEACLCSRFIAWESFVLHLKVVIYIIQVDCCCRKVRALMHCFYETQPILSQIRVYQWKLIMFNVKENYCIYNSWRFCSFTSTRRSGKPS